MKRIFLGLLLWLAAVSAAMAQAALLPDGKQQYFDNNGNPLAAGTINFYIPATTTPKTTWQDAGQTTPNTNPVVLDSAGRAIIYGTGTYRMLVKDSLGNTIFDALTQGTAASNVLGGATAGGSANAKTLTLTGYTNTNGAMACFINNSINTGSVTLNINSQGAIAVRSSVVSGDLWAGAIIANYYYCVVYNSTSSQYDLVQAPSLPNPGVVATTSATVIPATAANGIIYTGDATSATYNLTLPSAATWGAGKVITIQKIDTSTNQVRVLTSGSQFIDVVYDRVDLWSYGDSITLKSNGSNWVSIDRNIKTYTELVTSTAANYTPKRGVRQIKVTMVGGGGGGGSSGGCSGATRVCSGGGGGGGQTWYLHLDWSKMLQNTPAALTMSLTVGAGGGSNAAGNNSTFSWNAGAITYVARGGGAGSGGVDTAAALIIGVPAGATVQTAPVTIAGLIISNYWVAGTLGGSGFSSGSATGSGLAGSGGSTIFGIGAIGLRSDGAGAAADAQAYGAGGAGGQSQAVAADRAGGAGNNGAFLIEEIF